MEKVSAVVDAGLVARGTTEDLGLPRVEMAVEMDDAHGAVGTVDGAQERESDGVVTTLQVQSCSKPPRTTCDTTYKSKHARMEFSVLRNGLQARCKLGTGPQRFPRHKSSVRDVELA